MEINVNNKPSPKMDEFLNKVDELCLLYGYVFYPNINGWTGEKNSNGEYETFACIGHNEAVKLLYIDGDGRGK